MAERRSTYVFKCEEDYNDAKDHLYNEMSSDSNCFHFYGAYGYCSKYNWSTSYRIDIYSDCSNIAKAADIIREHGGRYYEL